MGAKKDRDIEILTYKGNKYKDKAKKMKDRKVPESKILKIEAKQERYELWLEEVEAMNDY